MKKLTILLAALVYATHICAQSAYYDALTLKKLKKEVVDGVIIFTTVDTPADAAILNPILQRYADPGLKKVRDLYRAYQENPFINPKQNSNSSFLPSAGIKSLMSRGGGLDVTKLADGLGKFLASRAKEEINVAFFERFRELLKSHPEVGHLFPVTTKYLDHIYNYEYANMLSTLRAAFESDLKELPTNIVSIAEIKDSECDKCNTKKIDDCKARLKNIKDAFQTDAGLATITGLLIVDGVLDKKNPAEILSAITMNATFVKLKADITAVTDAGIKADATAKVDTSAKAVAAAKAAATAKADIAVRADIYNTLRLLDIISSSLRTSDASKVWISRDELFMLQHDDELFRIFAGLLYQQIASENITIAGVRVADHFRPAQLEGLNQYLTNVVGAAEQIASGFRDASRPDTGADTRLRIKSMVSATRNFLTQATRYNIIHPDIPSPNDRVKQILFYTDQSLIIVEHILARDYYNVVLNTALILEDILKTSENFNPKGVFVGKEQGFNIDSALTRKEFVASVLKYGNFMANVVYAENSDGVKKAIESVALPPGASIIKKATNFSIAVQAYTGFTYGIVYNNERSNKTVGVYAPVGVSFSTGLKSRSNPYDKRSYGSLTAMVSLIDVGAIVAYRFSDPETPLADTVAIRLENIFAPGLNIVYGVPKLPLSIGTGYQWTPSLSRLSNENATLSEHSGWRWHVFLALDLPLLHIHSSKR